MTTETMERTAAQPRRKDNGQWTAEGATRVLRRGAHETYSTASQLRRQLLPHATAGTVLASGLAAQAITAHGISPTAIATTVAAAGFPTAVGVWRFVKSRSPQWARRVLLGGLFSAAWLTAAPFGVGHADAGLLVAAEYALAARWWQVNRLGYPNTSSTPAEQVPLVEVPPGENEPAGDEDPRAPIARQIVTDWHEFIGSTKGALPGSSLANPSYTAHTIAFDLMLSRGQQSLRTALGVLERISSGLNIHSSRLIIEQEDADPQSSQPARCRFQVVTNSPIHGDVNFDGPRRHGGLLDLGPYADGSGEAQYRLYTPGSMWSGVIIGGTGIGKSRVVENVVISALSGGDTEYWFIDPQRGVSSPALAEHANWFVSMDQAGDMLKAATAILEARGEEASVEGWTGFTPSPDRPGLLIVIEECHNVFANHEAAEQWAKIAREGRKVGIAILVISQYPGLLTFGGNEALRSSVMEGNALVLRSTSRQTGQLMAGLQVDPMDLPKIPGYAYVQGSDETGVRTAPFRNRNTGESAGEWLVAQPRAGLETLAATATTLAGNAYTDRHASSDTGRAASAARVQALREGRLPDGLTSAAQKAAPSKQVGEVGVVVEFPRAITPEDLTRPAGPAAQATFELTDSHRAVLDAVAEGADRPADVEQAVGLSHRQVAYLLRELVDAGYLTQPKYGRYQAA